MINIEDELFSDTQTDYSFNELIEELERNGKILEQWENGAPVVDNRETAQKTETKKER